MEVLITGGIGILASIISSWTTWFYTRKKYNSEVDSQLILNMKESLEFYKALSDDNKDRLDEVLAQNKEILAQNDVLLKQNTELKVEVDKLRHQIELLSINKSGKSTSKKDSK